MRTAPLAFVVVSLAWAPGGCTALLDYPSPQPEECNGRDDDFDGVRDDGILCLDPCPDDPACEGWDATWVTADSPSSEARTAHRAPWADRDIEACEGALFLGQEDCVPFDSICEAEPDLSGLEEIHVEADAVAPGTGSDTAPFPTIAAAIERAAVGAWNDRLGRVVVVGPGIYDEDLDVPDFVRVVGACPGTIVAGAGSGPGPVVRLAEHAKLERVVVEANRRVGVELVAQSARLVGVRVSGAGDAGVRFATGVPGLYPVELFDVVIHDTAGVGLDIGGDGVSMRATNVFVAAAGRHGISLRGSTRFDATGVVVVGAGSAEPSSGLRITEGGVAVLRGLVVRGTTAAAIEVETGSVVQLSDANLLTTCPTCTALRSSSGGVVRLTRVVARATGGAVALHATRSTVTGTDVLLRAPAGLGARVEDLAQLRLLRAVVEDADVGIFAYDDVGHAPDTIAASDLRIHVRRTGAIAWGGDVDLERAHVAGAGVGLFARAATIDLHAVTVLDAAVTGSGVQPWNEGLEIPWSLGAAPVGHGGFGVIVQFDGALTASGLVVSNDRCGILVHRDARWNDLAFHGGAIESTDCGCWADDPELGGVGGGREWLMADTTCIGTRWSRHVVDDTETFP